MIEEKKAGRKFIEIQDCTKQRDIHSTKLKVGKEYFFRNRTQFTRMKLS
jgi:hypothetical protein